MCCAYLQTSRLLRKRLAHAHRPSVNNVQSIVADNSGSDLIVVNAETQKLMAKAKVMMVDDEQVNMEVLQLHLTAEGYDRFVIVSDSTQAMDVIRIEQPSVLLLDLVMPEVSGFDILEMVRSDDDLKQIPIIVLTASNDSATKLRALQLGATDFLAKPVDTSELALRIKNTIVARAHEQRLKHFDGLTNLPNRLYFSRLVRNIERKSRDTTESLALILIKVNRFKSINSTFGSVRGDDILWAFSQRLQEVFESTDKRSGKWTNKGGAMHCLSRLGGARFGVLIKIREKPDRDPLMLKLLPLLADCSRRPFVVDLQDVYLTVCMGISSLDASVAGVEALINSAESAMSAAIQNPVTGYAFYNPELMQTTRRNLQMENAMRRALSKQQLSLVYQPKINVATGQLTGAEALLRWSHPEFGNVSPVEFIPVAETSGMIVAIGHWVLKTACAQAVQWRKAGCHDFVMAVNVSIRQLHESAFLNTVAEVLRETGLPPESLILELTENMIMENVDANTDHLNGVRELGVKVSIDDFGTGYSSLSYLQRLPVDQLKIDRSFIMEIESADATAPIVKAIVSLAHDLNLTVVAEGVENKVQLDYINSLGCEEYQGYYKSRPLSVRDFQVLLNGDIRKCA